MIYFIFFHSYKRCMFSKLVYRQKQHVLQGIYIIKQSVRQMQIRNTKHKAYILNNLFSRVELNWVGLFIYVYVFSRHTK